MALPQEPIIDTETEIPPSVESTQQVKQANLANQQTIENIEKIQLQLETKIKNIQAQRDDLLEKINECSTKLKETEFLTKKLEEKNKQMEDSQKEMSDKYVDKLRDLLKTFN